MLQLKDSPAKRNEWSVVILDEASRIKNRETSVSRACKQLPRNRRWALTGTPLENKIDDVLSILEFLEGEPGGRGAAITNESNLKETLNKLQLRRKKENVLKELPAKQIIEQTIELLPAQRLAYVRAEQEGIIELEKAGNAVSITHILELITRLKQICNNDPISGQSVKIDDIEERLYTLVQEGHRALVFSQYTDSRFGVKMICDRLSKFSPLTFTGAMSASQKDSVIHSFTNGIDNKALILSLRSGGVGLNLQAASYVFHLDRWWNPAIEDQAESRSHRMGQLYPVTVFRYICSDTIEERIDEKLKMKRKIFSDIIDEVSIELQSSLTEDELFGLFGLKAPKKNMKVS